MVFRRNGSVTLTQNPLRTSTVESTLPQLAMLHLLLIHITTTQSLVKYLLWMTENQFRRLKMPKNLKTWVMSSFEPLKPYWRCLGRFQFCEGWEKNIQVTYRICYAFGPHYNMEEVHQRSRSDAVAWSHAKRTRLVNTTNKLSSKRGWW